MAMDVEVDVLRAQEAALQFPSFDAQAAWKLGSRIRELAAVETKPVAIGIWMAGQTMFYAGTNGMTPDNEDWLRRKRNTVLRLWKSSLRVGMELAESGTTLEAKQGLAMADYAAHGGGFPLLLRGTGCVGAVVVSGLPQREDHALAVQAISEMLAVEVQQLASAARAARRTGR